MGLLESDIGVTIVRLTFDDRCATARALNPDSVKAMVGDALMRSTGVLGALFHHGVVVTEGDADRSHFNNAVG